jgi:hypothetical protein
MLLRSKVCHLEAKFIPALFERFLLKDHDAIFDDVLESLPRDPEWIEGIAAKVTVALELGFQIDGRCFFAAKCAIWKPTAKAQKHCFSDPWSARRQRTFSTFLVSNTLHVDRDTEYHVWGFK